MTWYDYSIKLGAHINKQIKDWEHSRFIGYWSYAMQSTKPISIHEFYPLPTDKVVEEKTTYTIEERQQLAEIAIQRLAQIQKK